jgi:anti-sigma B factor antagonist
MSMLPNGFEVEQAGQLVTAHLRAAEVAHDDMQALVQECIEKLRYSKAQNFIFDLKEVEFLASACIGALVEFLQEVEHCRGQIALVNCQDNVAFLFKVTRLDQVFGLYDDIEEAIASL